MSTSNGFLDLFDEDRIALLMFMQSILCMVRRVHYESYSRTYDYYSSEVRRNKMIMEHIVIALMKFGISFELVNDYVSRLDKKSIMRTMPQHLLDHINTDFVSFEVLHYLQSDEIHQRKQYVGRHMKPFDFNKSTHYAMKIIAHYMSGMICSPRYFLYVDYNIVSTPWEAMCTYNIRKDVSPVFIFLCGILNVNRRSALYNVIGMSHFDPNVFKIITRLC